MLSGHHLSPAVKLHGKLNARPVNAEMAYILLSFELCVESSTLEYHLRLLLGVDKSKIRQRALILAISKGGRDCALLTPGYTT